MPQTVREILVWWRVWWPVALAALYPAVVLVVLIAWPAVRRLLPPWRRRLVPWTAPEAFGAYLLWLMWTTLVWGLVLQTGLGERLYGPQVIAEAARTDGSPQTTLAQARVSLLVLTLAFPLQVVSIPAFLRITSGTHPYQLGLTTHRAAGNVWIGTLAALVLVPPVLALHVLAQVLLAPADPDVVEKHPFVRLAKSGALSGAEWVLLVFTAVVAAPVLEELLFRGVIQRWAACRPRGGDLVVTVALVVVVTERAGPLRDAWPGADAVARLRLLAPLLFVLAMSLIHVWVCRRSKTPFGPALFGTSLLFAVMHSTWPDPVALFALALGLGWLAGRTGSLVGPVVLHGLFNGVACVQLLWLT